MCVSFDATNTPVQVLVALGGLSEHLLVRVEAGILVLGYDDASFCHQMPK